LRSRAAFKLAEIDDRYKVLKPGARVVDLGAAPGGWSEIAVHRVGVSGRVVALDILDMKPVPGVEFLQLDFLDPSAPQRLEAMLSSGSGRKFQGKTQEKTQQKTPQKAPEKTQERDQAKADVVLSDMAANATGHRQTDHLRVMALAEAAANFARQVLAPGGVFLCKVLQGGTETTLLAELKWDFSSVKHVKPPASRSDSAELYLLAKGFRG